MNNALTSAHHAVDRVPPFAWTVLLGFAALTIALAGVKSIADIIGPVFLTLCLLALAQGVSVAQLAALIPQYTDQGQDAMARAGTTGRREIKCGRL